jgi:hypothetical protein
MATIVWNIKKIEDQLKSIKELKGCIIQPETSKTIRLDIPENNVQMRNRITGIVLSALSGSTTDVKRPHDVKITGGFTVLVKPSKGARKTASGAYYGKLAELDLKKFNTREFQGICNTFASGSLVNAIKESSDIKCVSDLNKIISPLLDISVSGVDLTISPYTFKNVIGCIPVTNGEPKADVVLVCRKGNLLFPDGFISYKMGVDAKGFQNYSGLSEKSSKYIFEHQETLLFYKTLHVLSETKSTEDTFQLIKDQKIIGMSVWGMDFGKDFGINNCHFVAQGEACISSGRLKYSHIMINGDFNFEKPYQPVFGARYASGRNNKGPQGLTANNFRIGIFARAYRSKWLQ